MIEVEVHYYRKNTAGTKRNDYYVFPYFLVKGHANNGTMLDSVRVCSGVSACVIGIVRLLDTSQYNITCKSGLFEIKSLKSIDDSGQIDQDTDYALNTLLCQLFDIRNMYPTYFSRFEIIEVKEKNNYYERNEEQPKPFRRLKRERLGLPSNQESVDCEEN